MLEKFDVERGIHRRRCGDKQASMLHLFPGIVVMALTIIGSDALAQEKRWVTADVLNRRSCPDTFCPIVGRLYFREAVTVVERRGKWARITKYYPDTGCVLSGRADFVRKGSRACLARHGYRRDGKFAEWVQSSHISVRRPAEKHQPKLPAELMDTRIQGIPKVGESGNTERDVMILRKGALMMLRKDRCKKIEYGDKSVTQPGTYYVYCGGNRNHFFTADDVN